MAPATRDPRHITLTGPTHVILHDGAREYAHWAWDGAPPTAPPPAITTPDGDWAAMEWWDGEGRTWDRVLADLGVNPADVATGVVRVSRVLITTPAAYAEPGGQDAGILYPLGTTPTQVRLTAIPELVVRGDSSITVL